MPAISRLEDWRGWFRNTGKFCLYFVPHLVIAPLLLVTVVTFLHELGHAAVALGLGGEVHEFSFLPGADNMGHVRWNGPPDAPGWYGDLVSLGPYIMWSVFAALVIMLAITPSRLHWSAASTVFCWGYFVPMADIAWNLSSGSGDLAIGGLAGVVVILAGSSLLLIAYLVGFWVQRRLFHDNAVDFVGYLVSSVVIGGAFGFAALIGLTVGRLV